MAQANISFKQIAINKANGLIVGVTAGACFLVIFSLVASFMLSSQLKYNDKIISEKKKTLTQMKANITARDQLVTSYKAFVGTSKNVLGGDPKGTDSKDGENGRIVLDALPSKYDFPALTSSIEKLITGEGLKISSITGIDDEVAQSSTTTSGAPKAVEMPFEASAAGSYQSVQGLVFDFEHSIRPLQIQTMNLAGSGDNALTINITAKTYYQPEKTLNISTKVVR